jgi:hypothetical protein
MANATNAAIEDENIAIVPDHLAIEIAIGHPNANQVIVLCVRAPHKYHTQLHKERKDLIWKTLSARTMMKYMTTSVTN